MRRRASVAQRRSLRPVKVMGSALPDRAAFEAGLAIAGRAIVPRRPRRSTGTTPSRIKRCARWTGDSASVSPGRSCGKSPRTAIVRAGRAREPLPFQPGQGSQQDEERSPSAARGRAIAHVGVDLLVAPARR